MILKIKYFFAYRYCFGISGSDYLVFLHIKTEKNKTKQRKTNKGENFAQKLHVNKMFLLIIFRTFQYFCVD